MSSKSDDDSFSFDVDRNRLDDEWVQHPNRVRECSEKLAEAKREASLAKRRLEVLEAEVEYEVRSNPSKFGLDKVTDKSIASVVISDNRIEEANQELIQAEYQHDIYKGQSYALEAKKKALEDLVYLWAKDYYSSPRPPEGTREKMEEAKRKAAFGRKSKET